MNDLTTEEYVEMHGVKFFGKQGPRVSVEDVKAITPDLDNEAYVLRHFSDLPAEDRARLLGQEVIIWGRRVVIDDEFIDKQLATAGSNFDGSISAISSPQKLLALAKRCVLKALKGGLEVHWLIKGSTLFCTIMVEVTPAIKQAEGIPLDRAIGVCSVVEITVDNMRDVFMEPRGGFDGYVVNKIRGEPPRSDTLVVGLRWEDNSDAARFNTVFTGKPTPPFPNWDRQSGDEVEANVWFWKRHAFVV